MNVSDRIMTLHREAPLTDVHVHPSLKAFLYGWDLWSRHMAGNAFNPFALRSDFPALERGGVGVIWAAHHLPEIELFRQCFLITAAGFLVLPAYRKTTTGSRLARILQMIDVLEREVAKQPHRAEVAMSVADIARIRAAGKIAVVHAVEGAHTLEGKLDSLDALAGRGVAVLTLAHFFDNAWRRRRLVVSRNTCSSANCVRSSSTGATRHHSRPSGKTSCAA